MERAALARESVNDDGNAQRQARAGTQDFFCEANRRARNGTPGLCRRSIEGSDFDDFSGHTVLLAMLAALEIPALFEDLFEGFFAVGKRHPSVAVPLGTRKPDCKVPSHKNSPRFFIIPRRNRVAGRNGGAVL